MQEKQAADKDPSARPQQAFSSADLLHAWNQLAESHKEENLGLFLAMTTGKTRLEENTVFLSVDNAIQQDLVNEKKPELLSHLRKKLNNYAIQIETSIQSTDAKQKAYLPGEKLEVLIKKNPAVQQLKEALGLDLDY